MGVAPATVVAAAPGPRRPCGGQVRHGAVVAALVAATAARPLVPVPSFCVRQVAGPLVAEPREGPLRRRCVPPPLGVTVTVPGLQAGAGQFDGGCPLGETGHRMPPAATGRLEMVLPRTQVPARPGPLPTQGPAPTAPQTDAVEVGAAPGVPADVGPQTQGPKTRADVGRGQDAPVAGEVHPPRQPAGRSIVPVATTGRARQGAFARRVGDRAAPAPHTAQTSGGSGIDDQLDAARRVPAGVQVARAGPTVLKAGVAITRAGGPEAEPPLGDGTLPPLLAAEATLAANRLGVAGPVMAEAAVYP